MLNDQQKAVVKATAPILATNGEALLAHFYSRLLTHNPELKQLFNMTHQRTGSQPRALAHAVHAYAIHIDDPSVLAGALRHTAMRHCSVGVRAEHYPIIGRHLIAAIREVLGEIATPSVIDAWSADYNQLAAMMIALEQDRYSSAAQAPGGWSCWRGFVLTDRHEETADAVSLTLGPANNGSVVQVRPGEYVSVRVYIPGENLVQPRQYTVTATNENSIRITVRRISARDSLPAGMVSNVLCDLAAGALVDLSAPTGGFRLPEGDAPLVFITAGIGVTPAAAMLRSVDEIESRISGHEGRHLILRTTADHGRPSAEDFAALVTDNADYLLCGPAGFMKAAAEALRAAGVLSARIRTMYPKEESLMCWHLFKGGTAEVIRRWIENIKARGGELLTNTRVTKLIMTDGRVTGVEATTKSGDKLIIHAKKVIIATGGFAANKEMLAQYVFDSSALGMVEPIWLRSPVVDGRTGDGINMARLVGAGVAGMHAVAGNAPYLPDTPPINQFSGPDELKQGRCALAQPWLWVDHTGRRFFNESRGSVFVDVYNAMTTAGGVSYTIFDQKMMDRMINKGAVLPFNAIVLADTPLKALPKTWEIGKERGWAFKADSIEELAQQIGVPPENLKDTMKKVNGYAEKGHDPEFGRKPEHLVKFDLEHGPYYALKAIRAFFLTLGGVQVTPAFEAKTPQGDVIPNLYVIGQDIGGLYDSSYDLRCEGSASSFAMTSGRYAAEHALKRIQEGK